jgi:3-oxoacyl-[acyl-carrier-protein] synthase III
VTATITPAVGAPHARILSVGAYRPERVVTNAEICERIDSTDEWIRERSGIIERHFAAPDESVVDMATAAATVALERSGITVDQIGMVMLATVTHPYQTPSAAAEVADRLGAIGAAALDLSAACAGFCYGLAMANDMIRGGSARYVVLVGVEKLSDWVNPDDRGTAFLFADGAGAVVIGPSEVPGIGPVVWGADGSQKDAITMTQSLIDYRDNGGPIFPTLEMQGQQVFRWAVGEMAKASQRALDVAGVDANDLDAFIPHQANMRITDAMVRALKLPEHVPVARDIAYTGNTSAASVPLAMDRMLETGQVQHGGTALLIGFGAGLVFAAQVVTLP